MKKIKFSPLSEIIANDFKPIKSVVPEWFKKLPTHHVKPEVQLDRGTVKKCIPFLDALTSGYTVVLSQDIVVKQGKDPSDFNIHWAEEREDVIKVAVRDFPFLMPIPDGYSEIHTVWAVPMNMLAPKGYSLLITQPFNRHDLPFITTTGIVDCDVVPMLGGNIPFFLRRNFNGLIPAGTPIMQIIPIKREKWNAEFDPAITKDNQKISFNNLKSRGSFSYYKKMVWQRKSYE
jgi:hypothetical protein